jgi:pimeloyl-ACP methyl ester carboxylesterase
MAIMPHQPERLTIRGINVRALRGGAGAPVLFLHGAGGRPAWLPFFEKLSQRYEVLVPEHPGFGTSDNPSWIRHVRDLAMYYLDVLDSAYQKPVHLIGHSLGGWTAAELAVRNCTRLASLTLLAPAGIRVKGVPPGDNFIWSPEEAARNRFHNQALADAALKAPPPVDDQIDEQLQNQLAAVKFGWEPRWFDPDLEKWLHRITVPTHVLWGRDDKILPAVYAALWGERVSGAQVTMVDDCGHLPQVEKADAVADKVLSFLDRVRP